MMTYDYVVDPDAGLVTVRLSGAVTRDAIIGVIEALKGDSRISRDFSQLIDLRDVTAVDAIAGEDVRAIASSQLDIVARRAFVAPTAVTFGLARMFASLRSMKGAAEEIQVFRTVDDATTWLAAGRS